MQETCFSITDDYKVSNHCLRLVKPQQRKTGNDSKSYAPLTEDVRNSITQWNSLPGLLRKCFRNLWTFVQVANAEDDWLSSMFRSTLMVRYTLRSWRCDRLCRNFVFGVLWSTFWWSHWTTQDVDESSRQRESYQTRPSLGQCMIQAQCVCDGQWMRPQTSWSIGSSTGSSAETGFINWED